MIFHTGQKIIVHHQDGAVFSLTLLEEEYKNYFHCHWQTIKDELPQFPHDNSGYIKYHAHDMNRWISEGKWNVTIEQKQQLPDDLFTI